MSIEDEFEVRRLSFADIPEAVRTHSRSYASDPLVLYLSRTPDKESASPLASPFAAFKIRLFFVVLILSRAALTVKHGHAFATFLYPRTRRPILKIVGYITGFVNRMNLILCSPEQKRRAAELQAKRELVIKEKLGDSVNSMLYLDSIATSPAYQGQGYGSALLRSVTDLADGSNMPMYLLSSNIDNTSFYNLHGFYSVAEITLGIDNSTWNGKPVVCSLMVRKARESDEKCMSAPARIAEVQHLYPFDILRTIETQAAAFASDPLMRYMLDTPDKRKASYLARFYASIRRQLYWTIVTLARGALTVDQGRASIAFYSPISGRPILRYMKYLAGYLQVIRMHLGTPEQKSRQLEFKRKAERFARNALGDDADSMFCIELLATSPEYQGRGYGSKLVKTVTKKADAISQGIYLISSNVVNTTFYNSYGFLSVAQFTLGEDNPTWQEKPVEIHLMVRKPS